MYKKISLTVDKLNELNHLLENAVLSNKEEIKKLESTHSALVRYNHESYRTWDSTYSSNFYSPYRNNKLLEFIKENILDGEGVQIDSIHTNSFNENGFAPRHKDTNSFITFIILLEDCEVGGRLLVEDEDVNFKLGDVISFIGHGTFHEVTKIIKGKRKTLTLFCSEKKQLL